MSITNRRTLMSYPTLADAIAACEQGDTLVCMPDHGEIINAGQYPASVSGVTIEGAHLRDDNRLMNELVLTGPPRDRCGECGRPW